MQAITANYIPSARVRELRLRAMTRSEELTAAWERGYHFLAAWMANPQASLPQRYCYSLAGVVENMPICVAPGEVLAGHHLNPSWSEFGHFSGNQLSDQARVEIIDSELCEERKKRLLTWLGRAPFAFTSLAPVPAKPEELKRAEERGLLSVWGTALNHSIRDYGKVLRCGFRGIEAEVREALARVSPQEPEASSKLANLRGWLTVCAAAAELGERHARELSNLARRCENADQRGELEELARICRRVPAHPAETFREAVQSLWFAHMITVWEDGVNANGIGRIDQMLWPYLERDLEAGAIDMEQASEVLGALWVKLYQGYDVQQMMIGGQLHDGSDAVNPLSYLVLDVTEGLEFVRCLSARLHRNSPREFIARCVDLVADGGGIPFFFNDEALVPALVDKGIPIEDARDYAAIGCIEITIPGKAFPHAVSHWINVAKCLELAMHDGIDLLDDTRVGPATGELTSFASMDDLMAAFDRQLEHAAAWAVYGSNACETAHRYQFRLPYLSLLTSGCIAGGADVIEGGARYNYHSSAAVGIPNAADSFAALETALFADRTISAEELLGAMRRDFDGREELRLYLANELPKYGNNHEQPDSYAARLTERYCDLLGSYRTRGGGTFHCHLFTFTLMLPFGKLTGASPDGRHAREPLAYSVSPVQGRDTEGLTAVVQSLARIPHHLAAASSSAILELDPSILKRGGKNAFVNLLQTAINLGVGQLQFNVVSADTLIAAQEHPEKHRNLSVRVSGFSQQFSLIDRELQDHIIARTKHAQ